MTAAAEAAVEERLEEVRRLSQVLVERTREAAIAVAGLVVDPADPAGQVAPPAAPSGEGAGPAPRLVPVLGPWSELALRCCALGSAAAAAWFWLWWVSTGAGAWTALTVTVTVILAWLFAMPLYFLFFACRMARVDPATPLPDLQVAMVVTRAPSEPWPVLRRTLEAMLAQEPGGHDVWLADEDPAPETLLWCLERGVLVASRRTDPYYQRAEWPRRARCKEGNLAFFYDHVGYDAYDVVMQFDADHVPGPGYLAAMLRPFADPEVGYVAAPSVCDANRDQGWTVRGRLHKEATLHGPVQAGANGGWSPLCFGSHYAVRSEALRSVGGLGPELAEDYTTTLWLQAGGWEGAFAIDAEAHGDGPESFDEMMLQEVQWARSLGVIATRWAPGRIGRAGGRAAFRLGLTLVFYLVQGLVLVTATVLPMVSIWTGRGWGQSSYLAFYAHLWPFSLASLAAVTLLRRSGVLRPVDAPLFSWEVGLFQLTRWPWNLWAFVQGARAGRRRQTRPFRVTPKGSTELKRLSVRYLAPTMFLALAPVAALLTRPGGPLPLGPALLALAESGFYLAAALAVVALHLAQNARRRRRMDPPAGRRPRLLGMRTGGSAALAVAFTAAVVVGGALLSLSTPHL